MANKKKIPLHKYMYISIVAAIATIILKTYAYYVTGSVGFLSDALESLVNLFAAVFGLVMLRLSQRPADDKHMYGHSKAEYFSGAIEGALILIASFSIIAQAVPRLINPIELVNVNRGLLYSLLASLVNLVVGLLLVRRGKSYNSLILEADGKHLLTDVVTSVGVIVAVILVKFTGWLILDPIIAILVGINIIYTGYKLISHSASGLMDSKIPDNELKQVVKYLDSLKEDIGIDYHSLMTRTAGQRRFIFFHLLLPGDWTIKKGHDLADKIERNIIEMFDEPITVDTHLEPIEDPSSMNDIGIYREDIEKELP
ncbi:MAG: cation diffusion facilitator family transporter [Fermentimonas sp.]|jgi:cation diffusion facilitator family transporter